MLYCSSFIVVVIILHMIEIIWLRWILVFRGKIDSPGDLTETNGEDQWSSSQKGSGIKFMMMQDTKGSVHSGFEEWSNACRLSITVSLIDHMGVCEFMNAEDG